VFHIVGCQALLYSVAQNIRFSDAYCLAKNNLLGKFWPKIDHTSISRGL
jgi:hypothetical protein